MAATMAMARGKKRNKKSKTNPSSNNTNKKSQSIDLKELMTKEDEKLFESLNDPDDEHVEDIDGLDGNDINASEIASFIKELGIKKYHASIFCASDENEEPENENEIKGQLPSDKSADGNGGSVSEGTEKLAMKKKQKLKKEKEAIIMPEEKNTKKKQSNGNVGLDSQVTPQNSVGSSKKKQTDPQTLDAALSYLKSYRSRKFLLIKPGEAWRDEQTRPVTKEPADAKLVTEAETLASRLLADEVVLYAKQRANTKRSEAQWLKTVLSSGTLTDKMAALTLLVQESPLHNASSIDTLIGMAGKKGRREALMAIDTLKDLYLTSLLPDDRKLKTFNHEPLLDLFKLSSGNIDTRDKLLLYWHFENLLKKKYAQFIKILGELSFDTLQATKEKAMSTVYHLLSSKPEQENMLLPMLVNKLGDQCIKSKASHWLAKLVDDHPNMKGVIVREIRQLLYRPNVSQRAQYYAICYLTQLRLSKDESELATQLIQIYFSFFQTFLKKGEMDSKMLSALLTGVNRAFVYASEKKDEILSSMDEVYKVIPSVNFHTGVQALMLLFHVTDNSSNVSDRFYTTLYRKLADPSLRSASKQAVFLSLLFKSLRRDLMNKRVTAFVKRILQVYSHHPPNTICGILILLSQIIKEKPGLLNMTRKAQTAWEADVSDEEENFKDLPIPKEFLEGEQNVVKDENEADEDVESRGKNSSKSSWLHRSNKVGKDSSNCYDPHRRNPLYSKADLDCVWELEELAKHFHPSVSLYANMILKGELIQYDGDPLSDFTLIRFLDRFVYKNPKKINNMANAGAPQKRLTMKDQSHPVNSKEFLDQGENHVQEDEKFFFKYFVERAKKKAERKKDESDNESVSDGEFDKYLDSYGDALNDDLGDMDMDFAGDKSRSKKKNKKAPESDSEDEEDDDDDLDLEDDELAAEFERELEGLENDQDEETEQEGDEDEEELDFEPDENDPLSMMMTMPESSKSKRKRNDSDDFMGPSMTKGKSRKLDSSNLFASAEEFSHLLEEDVEGGHVSTGGSNQMLNKDKAAKKQMVWEEKRDTWLNDKTQKPHKTWKGKGKKNDVKKSGRGFKKHSKPQKRKR